MRIAPLALMGLMAGGCGSTQTFRPNSHYPPDPYVKNYAEEDDCIGGEQLAAIRFDMPDYPSRAFRTGRQGWVLLRLDVAEDGTIATADVERSVPAGPFDRSAVRAARNWVFQPPESGGLTNCRVLVRYRLGEVSLGG